MTAAVAKPSGPGGLSEDQVRKAVEALTPEVVLNVRAAIAPYLIRPPLLNSVALTQKVGSPVFIKPECFMPTRTFKVRGALNKILHLSPAERDAGVITASAGNHGQGLAFGALLFGIPATVVVPEGANPVKVAAMKRLRARVVTAGSNYNAAFEEAMRLQRAQHATFVHAFDDPDVVAGQATVGLEMLEDQPDLDTLIVPIGGGGLISGIAAYAKQVRPDIRVVGVQPDGAPSMHRSLAAGHPVTLDRVATSADGLATTRPGNLTFAFVSRYVDDVVLVAEDEMLRAIRLYFEWEHLLAEPSGAAALAALLYHHRPGQGEKVGVVLSGANITSDLMIAALRLRKP
ncbi:MAG: threonine ammonia-lyase [Candidatus Dormibacteria bacterium]